MKMTIVCVKDRAINAIGTIFKVRTTAEAIRSFADEVNNKQSAINQHPEDYDLLNCGEIDDETGAIEPHAVPTVIVRAQDLIRQES